MTPQSPTSHTKRIWWFVFLAILGVATYTRMTNVQGIFSDGMVYFPGTDPAYYVRRVHLTVKHYPHVPNYDYYSNYPTKARLDWPIGYTLLLATVAKVAHTLAPSANTIDASMALMVPFLGVLICALIGWVGWLLGGRLAAAIAALIAAVIPMLTGFAMVGRVDHHVLEPGLVMLPVGLLLLGIFAATEQQARLWAITAGIAVAWGIAFWPGVIAFHAFLAGGMGLLLLTPTPSETWSGRLVLLGQWTFGTAMIAMLPNTWVHPWASDGSFVYFAPSWLQPLCYALAWLTFLSLAWSLQRHLSWLKRCIVCVGTPLVAGIVAWATLPGLRVTLSSALGYLSRTEAQISQVEESFPLFSKGFSSAADLYTWLLLAAPLVLVGPVLLWRREEGAKRMALQLAYIWFLLTGVLALAQIRLGSLFISFWCLMWGLTAVAILQQLRARENAPRWASWVIYSAFAAAFLPTLPLHKPTEYSGIPIFGASLDALRFLKHLAPIPDANPEKDPGFSVMTRWQWGHWLNLYSSQANVANPFGQTPTQLDGVHDSIKFYLARNPQKAQEILVRRKVRYILACSMWSDFAQMLSHTPYKASEFYRKPAPGRFEVLAPYLTLMNTRLHMLDGRQLHMGGKWYPPLRRFRLLYETIAPIAEFGRHYNFCKVFEWVRGARIQGHTTPNTRIELQLPLITNRKRQWLYRDQFQTDATGKYHFLVPYSTDFQGQQKEAVKAYSTAFLRTPTKLLAKLSISEQAVLQGQIVRVP